MKNKIKESFGERIYYAVVYTVLIFVAIVTVVPFLQVITISLSPQSVVSQYGLHLFPTIIDFSGYEKVLGYGQIWVGYANTIQRTLLGTAISVALYTIGAYPLSKKYLPHKKFWTMFIIFTMYFSGGLIPGFILVNNWLGFKESIWALVLPSAMSGYTLVIVRNFFESIPDSLEESAKLDGANDITVLLRIIVPLSKACLATITLWSIVFHWNTWFDNMIYMNQQENWGLQLVLRKILIDGQTQDIDLTTSAVVNSETMKMAALVVSVLPVIAIYPFVQKHFTKGVMVGAVKG